jgi:hypothetical protein
VLLRSDGDASTLFDGGREQQLAVSTDTWRLHDVPPMAFNTKKGWGESGGFFKTP